MKLHVLLDVQLRFKHPDGNCLNKFQKASVASSVDNLERLLTAAAVPFVDDVFADAALGYLTQTQQSPFRDMFPYAVIKTSFRQSNVLLAASATCKTINHVGGGHNS